MFHFKCKYILKFISVIVIHKKYIVFQIKKINLLYALCDFIDLNDLVFTAPLNVATFNQCRLANEILNRENI